LIVFPPSKMAHLNPVQCGADTIKGLAMIPHKVFGVQK